MAVVTRFDTPGSLRDLPEGSPFYAAWHSRIDRLISTAVPLSGDGEYVDPSKVAVTGALHRTFTWTGFPRPHLTVTTRDDRQAAFAAGEDRDAQHEYLEWHVTRAGNSPTGPITKVTFVTETPEYWTTLAAAAPDRVLELYREFVDPAVDMSDLFTAGGNYRPRNRWNTTDGIVHYVMSINSMRDLLGVSQEREPTGAAVDNFDALPYSRATAADARLNMDMWSLARKGLSVAPAEPIGIYVVDWDDTGWTRPDGTPVGDYWRVRRGAPGAALRVDYEVPSTEGFVVGDIRIGGRPITTGGQIAEHIVVSAHGAAGRRQS
jgi:hypothetical protein